MEDRLDPMWRVVIRNDPRSRQRVDDREYLVFGAGGAAEESDLAPTPVRRMPANVVPEGVEVEAVQVRAVDSRALEEDDDEHLADMEYTDVEDDD